MKAVFYLICLFFISLFPTYSNAEDNSILNDSIEMHFKSLRNKGVKAARIGNFELSENCFLKLYQERKKYYGEGSVKLVSSLNNLGISYKNIGENKKAIDTYKLAESICNKEFGADYPKLGLIYVNIGVVYKTVGNYIQYNEYMNRAYNILKNRPKYYNYIEIVKSNITESLFFLGQYDKAVETCEENIRKVGPGLKSYYTSILARIYQKEGNWTEANRNFLKTFKILNGLKNKNVYDLGPEYLNYVRFLILSDSIRNVPVFNKKAKYIIEKYYGKKSAHYSRVMLNYGDYYRKKISRASTLKEFNIQKQANLHKALEFYQKALIAVSESFDSLNVYSSPEVKQVVSPILALESLNQKVIAFDELGDIAIGFRNLSDGERYYKAGLKATEAAVQMLHYIRTGYVSQDSRLLLSQNQEATYYRGVNIAYKLYQHTHDRNYLQTAYELTEKGKAASFLASLKDSKATHFAGIPDSLIHREEIYKLNLSNYKQMRFDENQKSDPDTAKLAVYNSKIFQFSERYAHLIQFFEDSFPRYYALKYREDIVDLTTVQRKLAPDQAMIEYFMQEPQKGGSGKLFRYVITRDSVCFKSDDIRSADLERINRYHSFLSKSDCLYTSKADYKDYIQTSYYLYQKLFGGIDHELDGKHLIIIPDDKLYYIPFGALLASLPNDSTTMDFRSLDYLIRHYPLSYTYSATLLFRYFNSSREVRNGLLAFAPSYKNDSRDANSLEHFRSGLEPLPWARKEVQAVHSYVSGEVFKDSLAQKSTFLRLAPNYDILHLAMHTMVNDTLPMFSRLAFAAPLKDSIGDDGWLTANEIYSLRLRARMAVLSACNTGTGKLQKGEGVMSLARGFLYAGCPSIVMTLWEVEDQSGAKIMSNYYRFLKKGKPKDEALREAELQHLKEADPLHAHPHYWLGYVVVGNSSPLYDDHSKYFICFIVALLALWFVGQYISKKAKIKRDE